MMSDGTIFYESNSCKITYRHRKEHGDFLILLEINGNNIIVLQCENINDGFFELSENLIRMKLDFDLMLLDLMTNIKREERGE